MIACGSYPNIEPHLSDRAGTKTETVDALIRVRRLHSVCSHSSLGSLCFSQIRITSPHLTIISIDKAAEGTHQWSHSACVDSDTTLLFFLSTNLVKDKKRIQHVCHLSDKLIASLALWCYLRGRTQPHTHFCSYSYVSILMTSNTLYDVVKEHVFNLHLTVHFRLLVMGNVHTQDTRLRL